MDVSGVGSSKILKLYNNSNNTNKAVKDSSTKIAKNDSLEISTLGKKLSAYSIDDNFNSSSAKIDAIKNDVKNGTYNIDSKLVAEKIYDQMKERGV
ncbi:flagellar biosynthesis anti-sigma factor FlgM [Clostridium akagii]|uniref:flagellar biosynthesis anti-sigma factor FlgM n=1 Tax=Clostridium akagii TaxID=91623 RepID=UPI00047922DC|nr:flagellar biosynthesis anti-sigma factor FlgM [Clostridium akagii]